MRIQLGERVKRFRERANLSQETLANDVGISQPTIQRIERGRVWPEYENVEAIAKRLGILVEALLSVQDPVYIEPTPEDALAIIRSALEAAKQQNNVPTGQRPKHKDKQKGKTIGESLGPITEKKPAEDHDGRIVKPVESGSKNIVHASFSEGLEKSTHGGSLSSTQRRVLQALPTDIDESEMALLLKDIEAIKRRMAARRPDSLTTKKKSSG